MTLPFLARSVEPIPPKLTRTQLAALIAAAPVGKHSRIWWKRYLDEHWPA